MAPHAPAHGHVNIGSGRRLFTFADIPVTRLAFDLSKNDMATVGIKHVIRLSVDPFPGNLFFLLGKLPDFFLFRALRDCVLVALQADGDVRHSGEGLGLEVLVTGITSQSLVDMLLVIKSDRLVGFRTYGIGSNEEEDEDNPYYYSEEEEFHLLESPGLSDETQLHRVQRLLSAFLILTLTRGGK